MYSVYLSKTGELVKSGLSCDEAIALLHECMALGRACYSRPN